MFSNFFSSRLCLNNFQAPGVLYGLCKIDKAIVDVCPPFRPILSTIGTPTYKTAKFLVPGSVFLLI